MLGALSLPISILHDLLHRTTRSCGIVYMVSCGIHAIKSRETVLANAGLARASNPKHDTSSSGDLSFYSKATAAPSGDEAVR